jgi:hypothetical protein
VVCACVHEWCGVCMAQASVAELPGGLPQALQGACRQLAGEWAALAAHSGLRQRLQLLKTLYSGFSSRCAARCEHHGLLCASGEAP